MCVRTLFHNTQFRLFSIIRHGSGLAGMLPPLNHLFPSLLRRYPSSCLYSDYGILPRCLSSICCRLVFLSGGALGWAFRSSRMFSASSQTSSSERPCLDIRRCRISASSCESPSSFRIFSVSCLSARRWLSFSSCALRSLSSSNPPRPSPPHTHRPS
jgi:hypothetical protein